MPRRKKSLTEFGAVIENHRKRRGLTVDEFADLLGLNRTTIDRIMTGGRNISWRDIDKFATALQIAPARLARELPATIAQQLGIPPGDLSPQGAEIVYYVGNLDHIVMTLRNLPGAKLGPKWKLAFLTLYEQAAQEAGETLPDEFFDIRRRVFNGEI